MEIPEILTPQERDRDREREGERHKEREAKREGEMRVKKETDWTKKIAFLKLTLYSIEVITRTKTSIRYSN